MKTVDNQTVSVWTKNTLSMGKCFLTSIIRNILFCRKKKVIQVWNNLRVCKLCPNFHYWVDYPFKNKKG